MRNRIEEEETRIQYPPPPHPPPAGPSRPRREEEGISTRISGIISGYFIQVTVPSQLEVGQNINASVSFYAINPGALYWKSFLILGSPQLTPIYRLLDAARETGQEGGRTKTYNLGPMPNETVALSFFIFAHDDAGYDWNWGYYYAWMEYGSPTVATYLGSHYAFISPVSAPPQTETLEVDITPVGSGYVKTSPASVEGTSTWYDGTTGRFPYGESVKVTAYPYSGYVFDHWSDEIEGGVSYNNPAYAKPMTEHRAVKAHFRLVEVPVEYETLEIDITPVGKGYVITSPNPISGYKQWSNGSTGQFLEGTVVKVTAYPSSGYVFDHWSDEIEGGVSYSNPANVKPMTEHRAVKAHFRILEEGEEPPTLPPDGEPPEGEEPEKPVGIGAVVPLLIGGGLLLMALAVKPEKKAKK